jgi:predicted DNA-binding antitoxin AbrB/MazE fold protein
MIGSLYNLIKGGLNMNSITVEASYEDGILRLKHPLPLVRNQHVLITVAVPEGVTEWPSDVATIYQEIEGEDRRLAERVSL